MSRTYRKGTARCHRKPKGRKAALAELARFKEIAMRRGAIPPSAWDDIPVGAYKEARYSPKNKIKTNGKN